MYQIIIYFKIIIKNGSIKNHSDSYLSKSDKNKAKQLLLEGNVII